jgi:IclR family acetate operon transcriptional repressor
MVIEEQLERVGIVQSVERALTIMEVLAREGTGLGLMDISQQIDLSPSTTHRLLASLMSRGFVTREPGTRKYILGMKLLELSGSLDVVVNLKAVAESHVHELARSVGETVNLVVRDGSEAVIIDRVESQHKLRFSVSIGSRIPLHATAAGKVLLAHMPVKEAEAIINNGLAPLTSNTIVDPYQMLKELELIRARGYAIDHQEQIYDVQCVAAPIRNHQNQVMASVSVSGPSRRMTSQRLAELGEQIKDVANTISTQVV